MRADRFLHRYGPWALVAGGSEGLGAAFATELVARGLNVVLVARRSAPLESLAAHLRDLAVQRGRPARVVTVAADLAQDTGVHAVRLATTDTQIGLVIANAAYSPIGGFLDLTPEQSRRAVELNCLAPVRLAHEYLPSMVERGRGGFVLMSSLAGLQGAPQLSVYAATKAFGAVFAEGLWASVRGTGVDVVACIAGAVTTPGLVASKARRAPGTLDAAAVVRSALRALGRRPRVVPGLTMRISAQVMSRLLPRRAAIAMITRASRDLTPTP
jgi:uncharacterized protein